MLPHSPQPINLMSLRRAAVDGRVVIILLVNGCNESSRRAGEKAQEVNETEAVGVVDASLRVTGGNLDCASLKQSRGGFEVDLSTGEDQIKIRRRLGFGVTPECSCAGVAAVSNASRVEGMGIDLIAQFSRE